MILIYTIFIMIPLVTLSPYDAEPRPSYRSSVMEGDKPILRMSNVPESEENEEGVVEGDKPILRMPNVSESEENEEDDLMEPRIKIPSLHAPSDEEKQKTTPKSIENVTSNSTSLLTPNPVEPFWVTDLKDFVKDLNLKFGQDIAKYTKPVIASLEKKHHVQIRDIGVDQYGEIFINYVPTQSSNKKEKSDVRPLRYRTKYDGPKNKLKFLNSG